MGEDERGSSSSKMMFKGVLPSIDGRTGVKLRPRIWPWRLRVTSREKARIYKSEKDITRLWECLQAVMDVDI